MIAHEDRHANEAAIFALRSEPGLQEMRKWLYWRRDDINDKWMDLEGNDLLKIQGESRGVKRMIKILDHGPTLKGEA